MNPIIRAICLLTALVASIAPLTACSRMNVRVAILDKSYLASPEAAENLVSQRVPKVAAWSIDQSTVDKAIQPIWPPLENSLAALTDMLTQVQAPPGLSKSDAAQAVDPVITALREQSREAVNVACRALLDNLESTRQRGLLLAAEGRSMPCSTSNEIIARQQKFYAALQQLNNADAAMQRIDTLLADAAVKAVQSSTRTIWEREADFYSTAIREFNARVQAAPADNIAPVQPTQAEVALIALYEKLLVIATDQLNNNAAGAIPLSQVRPQVAAAAKQSQAILVAESGFIPPELSIFDDANASLVINAPNRYWRGEYNRAFAAGDGGNTDIAIVMQSPGSFSVKGLRNDTSKITAATFNVLKTSLVIATSAAGAPVPNLKITGTDGKPKDGVFDERLATIGNAEQTEAAARARVTDTRAELASLALIITSQDAAINSDAPKSLQNIKAAYAAARRRLAPPTTSPGN